MTNSNVSVKQMRVPQLVASPGADMKIVVNTFLGGKRTEGYGSRPFPEARFYRKGFVGPMAVNVDELEAAGLSREEAEVWSERTARALAAISRIYGRVVDREVAVLERVAAGELPEPTGEAAGRELLEPTAETAAEPMLADSV